MSLQGPMIVVAEKPAIEVVNALRSAGAFPIIEANWADAPTAFVAVKPAAIVIAEPGPPPDETKAHMLCRQIATAAGPVVPAIARVTGRDQSIDDCVHDRVMRCEQFAAGGGNLDPNLVIRRNERAPGFGDVRLAGDGEHEPIDHCSNDFRVLAIIIDRVRIVIREDD